MDRMKTKVDGLNNSDASASISSAASVSVSPLEITCHGHQIPLSTQRDDFFFLQTFRFSLIYSTPLHLQTRESPRQFGTQLHASLGNRSSSQSLTTKVHASSRFSSATTGNKKNATALNDATYRIIRSSSNSTIQVNGNSTGHPPSSNNNFNSTSTRLSNLHRMLKRSPSYITVTLTTVEIDNRLKSGDNCCKWGFIVARQLTFVQNTFSDIMPNANVEHGHGSTSLCKEEENVKVKEEDMDSCSDSQSTIDVNGYPATKKKDELVVSIVQHGSPAHDAGLVEGDIIDSVYGQNDPTLSLLFGIMRDSTRFVVKVKRMESSFERGFREKQTECVPAALVEERISGECVQSCDDDPGRLGIHNDLEKDLLRPLDGDNDQNVLSAVTDDDLLGNDIALAMVMAPQYLTDAIRKSRTGIDILYSNQASSSRDVDNAEKVKKLDKHSSIATLSSCTIDKCSEGGKNRSLGPGKDSVLRSRVLESCSLDCLQMSVTNQAARKAVQDADDSDDGRIQQVAPFDRVHAPIEKNGLGKQKKHASGSDSVCMVKESPCLDETDVQEESISKKHASLHYDLHVDDEEMTFFDQSDVEPATDYQPQAECGSSTSDSDDQMREEPFRDSLTVQTMDKSSNKDSRSERRGEDDVREEENLLTAKKSITSESEKGESVVVPPRQKKSKSKAKKRKVIEDFTLSKQEKISKSKRKKGMCQGEDEMAKKDAKQNGKKERKKERKGSYYHLVVPAGTNVISANDNGNDNGNAHEEVVEEHTVAATELVEEGSIPDKYENITGLAGMPALHSPPTVNSKKKCNQAYESKSHEKWNRFFTELVECKDKNGHCNIPTTNGSLGRWISKQRNLFRSKKLKKDRYEKLVGIGFTFEHIWNRHFVELVEYKKENGHCDIPQRNGSLGKWISKQRELFRSKKLKKDRYEKLVGIGFSFAPRKKRKMEDLGNDLAAMTHDEGEKSIDNINANGDVNDNDNGNAHEEVLEEHAVAAMELVEEGIKEGHSPEEVAIKTVQL